MCDEKQPQNIYIIDARSHSQFIGWKNCKDLPKGHLKNSISIDIKNISIQKIQNQIIKKFKKQDFFKIYDSGRGQAKKLASIFFNLGYFKQHFQILNIAYPQFLLANNLFLYSKLFYKLIPAEYLIHLQKNQILKKDCKVIQFGYNLRQQFDKQHILQSIYIDSTQFQMEGQWMLRQKCEIVNILKALGLQHNNQIVVVNRGNLLKANQNEWSILASSRLAIILLSLGYYKTKILNGGYEEYKKCLEKKDQKLQKQFFELNQEYIRQNEQLHKNNFQNMIIGYQEVKQKVERQNNYLIDVRSLRQHKGLISGYDYCDRKGSIQKSIYYNGQLNYLSKNQIIQQNQKAKDNCIIQGYKFLNRMICFSKIKQRYKRMLQIQEQQLQYQMIFYCGNGWRASQILFYMIINGYKKGLLYSNGWIEWSRKALQQKKIQQLQNYE